MFIAYANNFPTEKPVVLGQSDIKKLRRENAQLKKEIWTLRDEYDRLGKLLTTKNRPSHDYDGGPLTTDCQYGGGYDYDYDDMDHCSCGCLSNEVRYISVVIVCSYNKCVMSENCFPR